MIHATAVSSVPHRLPRDPRHVATNRDWKRRDQILGVTLHPDPDGITAFHGLDAERLDRLLQEGFAPPGERQNLGPSIEEFLAFMRDWPEVLAFGYAVHPAREDYRVTLEGLACDLLVVPAPRRDALRSAFTERFRDADEFVDALQCLYAWWD